MVRILQREARDEAAFPCWQDRLCVDQLLHPQKCSPNSWAQKSLQILKSAGDVQKTKWYQTQEEAERGNTALSNHRENKHSSDPAEMTVKSKMWAARVVVISNKNTQIAV